MYKIKTVYFIFLLSSCNIVFANTPDLEIPSKFSNTPFSSHSIDDVLEKLNFRYINLISPEEHNLTSHVEHWKKDSFSYAVKQIKPGYYNDPEKRRTSCERASGEALSLNLDHPNIAKTQCLILKKINSDIYAVINDIKQWPDSDFFVAAIVMTYQPGQELFEYIQDQTLTLTLNDIHFILIEILNGLTYLHHKNRYTRDLKIENILVLKKQGQPIKVTPKSCKGTRNNGCNIR